MERLLLALTKQRVLVLVFFTLCIIGGLVAFQSVPIDAFPDLTNNQVQVLTETAGMAPVETEELVTIPIEALIDLLHDSISGASSLSFAVLEFLCTSVYTSNSPFLIPRICTHLSSHARGLLQYRLTLKELFDALANNNANFSGGLIEHNDQQYIVRGLGRVNSLADIGNIIVKQNGRTPILVSTIADVSFGQALRQGAVTKDGQGEVVTGMVMMLKGENSRNVINRVKSKIEGLHESLPQGVAITPFYDQTHLVEQTLHTVQSNLVEGGLLVITILLLMLGNLRAALIVAVTIPLSLMFSFMGMKAMGITANIMSLGALDFGMIVDGAIVMVENTLRKLAHYSKNAPQNQRIIINESLQEMAKPILFGVLIIAVVYMPILALEGMEYKLFSPMVFTVIFALLGSLLVALLLVPVLCSFFLRGKTIDKSN